jgi:putative sigma-54 modulation protein
MAIGDFTMHINIAGHHLDITEALRDYVTSKLKKLERHFDQVSTIDVILSIDKLVQKAEATVPVNGQNLFAFAEDEDMYAAIDALVDKLDRQIIKRKEKATNHHRGAGTNKRAQI